MDSSSRGEESRTTHSSIIITFRRLSLLWRCHHSTISNFPDFITADKSLVIQKEISFSSSSLNELLQSVNSLSLNKSIANSSSFRILYSELNARLSKGTVDNKETKWSTFYTKSFSRANGQYIYLVKVVKSPFFSMLPLMFSKLLPPARYTFTALLVYRPKSAYTYLISTPSRLPQEELSQEAMELMNSADECESIGKPLNTFL
jgi:hypothetical protein